MQVIVMKQIIILLFFSVLKTKSNDLYKIVIIRL